MELKLKFILSIFLSILIGLYIAFHLTLFSGMNPFLDTILFVIVVMLLVWNLVLIFKEQDKPLKFIQLSIFVLVILIAFYSAKIELESLEKENPRMYFKPEQHSSKRNQMSD